MKKSRILLLLAAATVMASCQKNEMNDDVLPSNGSVISAVIDDDNSKTTLDGVKVCWVSGDAIAINKKQYTASPDADDARYATFTLSPMASAPTDAPFCAYYPYSDNRTTTKGQFKLSSTQYYSTTSPLGSSPMYAVSESLDGTFHFKNVCGLLTLDLKGIGTVSKIEVSANENLAGTLSDVAINEKGELTYGAFLSTGASNKVSLSCGSAATLSKETARRFYIALPEGDFTGLKVTVTTDLGTMTIPATKTVSIKKNNIYHMPEMTVTTAPITFSFQQSTLTFEKAAYKVTPSVTTVNYYTEIISKEVLAKFGDVETYATAMLEYYLQSYTPAKVISALMHKGAYTISATVQPETDYCLMAFAVDSQCNIVSTFATEEFKTPAMPVASAKYEDYLGEWMLGTDVIKIEQKVAGSTYNLSGIYPQNEYSIAPVEATFQDGYIFLNEQKSPSEITVKVSGAGDLLCEVYLSGLEQGETLATYPFYTSTPVTIFRGEFDGDETIKVSPGATSYGDIVSVAFSWVIKTGEYAGNGSTFDGTKLVDMIAKKPLPEALLGQWTCASATDEVSGKTFSNWVWTISEASVGVNISNFDIALTESASDYTGTLLPAEAMYVGDDKGGVLTVVNGTKTGLTSKDGDKLYWYGDYYTDYDTVFNVDLENGTITMEGDYFECDINDGDWTPASFYNGPIVFTKGTPTTGKANATTSNANKAKSASIRRAEGTNHIVEKKNGKETLKPASLENDTRMKSFMF